MRHNYVRVKRAGLGGILDDLAASVTASAEAAAKQTASNALNTLATSITQDPQVQAFAQQQAEQAAIQAAASRAQTTLNWIKANKMLILGGGVGLLALVYFLARKR